MQGFDEDRESARTKLPLTIDSRPRGEHRWRTSEPVGRIALCLSPYIPCGAPFGPDGTVAP
jgi:hypothetical protein